MLRPVSAVMYIDESGKVYPTVSEVNAVGALAIPHERSAVDLITNLVGTVMEENYGDRSTRDHKMTVENLTDLQLARIADTIRTHRWYVAYDSLPPNTPADDKIWAKLWTGMGDTIDEASRRSDSPPGAKAKCKTLRDACDEMRAKHPLWTWFVFRVQSHMAKLFHKNGLIPKIKVLIDEHGRHSPLQNEFLRFLTRFTFSTQFMEVYKDRLSFVLGLKLDGQFTCESSSDRQEDGIHFANLIAHAQRRIALGKDHGGRIQKFFDRCNATWSPVSAIPPAPMVV